MLDIGKPGGMTTFLTLKVRPDSGAAQTAPPPGTTARAGIEITLSPIQRPTAKA